MTTNRLALSDGPKVGKVTVGMLHDLAASLNAEWWVHRMGRHYGVGVDEQGRAYLKYETTKQ